MMRKTTVLLLLALAIALALPGVAGAASNDHVYRRDNEEYPFHWGADLFEERSQIYDNDLAVASAVLSWGVEVSVKQQIQDLFAGLRIENLYTGCYDGGQSYKTWQEWGWGFQDGVFAIGHCVLTMDSANDTTLLVVVGRGTMTPGEMRTDFFNTGNGSRFVAGKTVKQNISTYQRGMWLALEDYLRVHPVTTPKVKMLITGHSLGGAMANLFGAKIIHDFDQIPWLNGKATQDDIYVYTFGAIKVLDQEQNVSQGYENIHNIYNKYDTFGPEGKNTLRELDVSSPNAKFGHTDLFARVFEEGLFSTNAHNMDAYLFALAGGDMVHCAFSEAFEQDESDGVHDETIVLSREDTLALLASVSDTPLMAASGAGAWEGRLKINADATFSGYYYDEDADVIYESSFSGSLNPYAEVYGNRYWLWVNEVTTRQTPGTTAMSEYGIPVIYEEAPLRERDYVVLTLPGTPDGEIPEMVREEIGGVLGEWEDYSRFITLTRWDDGWGFFADPDDPPDFDPVPAATAAPDPTPAVSRNGDVLVDDEICTIVNLGKDMHPAIGDLFPRPFYRLAVTNHLDREIIFRPGTRDGRKLGTVNGLQIRAAVSGAGGGVLSGEKQVAVPAKQTVEIILRPEGYGVGFRSVDELANTDLFVHVLYGDQAGNGREYELRMDAGTAYRYPDAMGYAVCSPECLGISFEIPDNWEVCFVTGDGVSKEAPESAVYSNGFGGQYGITMEILNQPTLYDNGIFIGVETAGTQDELADNYAWSEQRLEDTVIGGRRACRLRFSDYDKYGRYLVTNDDGLVLNILIREGYRESAFLDIIEHFLNTFRFTPGDSRPDETADETAVSWPGIWRARRQDGESRLYIFPYEWDNGTYDVILLAEKNGSAVAAAGMIYRVDEITMEFYADGLLDAGLVQAPGIGLISLTPFSAMNDALLPWLESIEADYEYIGPLDDPDRQIPSYVWDLTRQREYPAEGSVSFTLPPAFSDNDWMRDAVSITDPTIDPGMIYTAQTPVPSAAPMPTSSLASAALVPIPGKRGCLQVPVSRVDATSHIVGSRDPAAYAPVRMLDGEETTAFQFSTGTTPLGQAYLSFDFDGPVTLDELWIKNGFWKITDGLDQYTRNSRIKKMTIFVRFAGADGDLPLREATLADDPARRDWQTVSLPGAQNVTGVRIRVDEIYTGSRFPTDVCISEIMFVRRAEQ